jgi:transcriptional regulator with XRE-family HTH domain
MSLPNLGDNIRMFRLIKNYKIETMARLLEMSAVGYGNIERSGAAKIRVERVYQISDVLKVPVADFFSLQGSSAAGPEMISISAYNSVVKAYELCVEQLKKENEQLQRKLAVETL